MNLSQKIAKLRTMVTVTKNKTNAFGKYKYYSIDDIYADAKNQLNELGLSTVETVEPIEVAGEPLFLFKLKVTDGNESEYFTAVTKYSDMKGMVPTQEAGSLITYMTKYLYGLLLMIDDGAGDPDGVVDPKEQTKVQQAASNTPDRKTMIKMAAEKFTDEELKEKGIKNVKFATNAKLTEILGL